ncbi:MAG: hybrid sensor histidine kinase/response regulator [Methylococcales bacterium]
MHNIIEKSFANASRRLVSSLQPWSRRHSDVKDRQNLNRQFFVTHFDTDDERQFWQERHLETLNPLKIALLLGGAAFLAFIVLDLFKGDLPNSDIIGRLSIVFGLGMLFLYLHKHAHPENIINLVTKLSTCLSAAGLIAILLMENQPDAYINNWIGLVLIYFFTYGQMLMTIPETLTFGILTMIALPLSGYLIGVAPLALMPSIIILLMVNVFGFCTRCQLEIHARNLFKERRSAESKAEDKVLFLQQLGHNLRQPLQALSCYCSVLDAAYKDKPSDQLQPVVGKLGSTIDELNAAFNNILDIANLQTGKQIPLLAAVEINLMLAALEDQFTPQAAKRGLKLIVQKRSHPPYTVYSDACILGQIIGNLIDNAIKYTTTGWILVKTVKIGSGKLKLHVYDTGIGIADQQKQNIFKEFYRGQRRRDDPHVHGLGLGLAYVLKAVERLPEHSLRYYSQSNRGSDFQIQLPVAISPPFCKWQPDNSDLDVSGNFVFIVDDDQKVLDALAQQISSWGCLVQKAGSVAETLAALADNIRSPDLLITDFYLEDQETAHDIIAAIEADCGPVPTLILSAHAIPAEDKAKWSKNTLLLRKPASAAVLLETMAKVMDG